MCVKITHDKIYLFFFKLPSIDSNLSIIYYRIREGAFVGILHICKMKIGKYHDTLSFII